jgi:hypothetical protein
MLHAGFWASSELRGHLVRVSDDSEHCQTKTGQLQIRLTSPRKYQWPYQLAEVDLLSQNIHLDSSLL